MISKNLRMVSTEQSAGGTAGHGGTTCPLPTTVIPPLDTTRPRARSWFLSTPTVAPSWTTTFLSASNPRRAARHRAPCSAGSRRREEGATVGVDKNHDRAREIGRAHV